MTNSVKCLIKESILSVYLIILFFILNNHYFEMGECAAIVYFHPLGCYDYILIPLVGIFMLSISWKLVPTHRFHRVIEALIYVSIIIFTIIWGNEILASITINWPHKYHPTAL